MIQKTKTIINLEIPEKLDKRLEAITARYAKLNEFDKEDFIDDMITAAEDRLEAIECRG